MQEQKLIEMKEPIEELLEWLHTFDDLQFSCNHRNVIEKIWQIKSKQQLTIPVVSKSVTYAKTRVHITSNYQHVYGTQYKGDKIYWQMKMPNNKTKGAYKIYDTEILAAKAVDMYLIRQGKEPVNILKRKTK